ncbi:hypothetical protein ACLOJK_018079 [Asimina triloba]
MAAVAASIPFFNLAPDLKVSRLCLGTMTFGEQNSLQHSFHLLDQAFHAGINFFDTAEMYPVPQRASTYGRSEEYIGRWIKERRIPRDRIILATKVAGPSGQMTWIRGGPNSVGADNILQAIDDSYVPMFGETEYDSSRQFSSVPIEEQLEAFKRAIDAGKIRYVGLSNETPYGVMKFLQLASDAGHHPKIVSVQGDILKVNPDTNYPVLVHPLVASVIFGAAKPWQLKEVIEACNVHLTQEIIAEINRVHALLMSR